ncbi:MAG: 30S ribosomal protein S18 [Microthrixaceae bacterium]|nr:30S ribosomal protein S18 [Microthrixaceae bacterium]
MKSKGSSRGPKQRESSRRTKKKVSVLVQEQVDYIDWKDVNLLRRFMSDRAKIRARRVTGNDTQQQRQVAMAIKNAREMALLPYTSRVTTQRGRPRGDGEDDRRRPRRDERESTREESTEEFEALAGGDDSEEMAEVEA